MKLWILEPVLVNDKPMAPWVVWFDKCFGLVVRAETEEEAREIADANSGDETAKAWELDRRETREGRPWLHAEYSVCRELTDEGEPGLILRDVANA